MSTLGAFVMPFGTGPFGLVHTEALAEDRAQVTASRYVDANGRFRQIEDGTGGFVGTTDAMHRATMLLGRFRPSGHIGANLKLQHEPTIRNLLAPLTRGREPVIEILEVIAEDSGRGTASFAVRLFDLTDRQIKILRPT